MSKKEIKINGVTFMVGENSFDTITKVGQRTFWMMDRDHLRQLADWLYECCDEGEERPRFRKTVFKLEPTEDDKGICYLEYQPFQDDPNAVLLISCLAENERGRRLTADQCDELASKLRQVARWDRARRAEEAQAERQQAKDKVRALVNEIGADTIIELAKGLKDEL